MRDREKFETVLNLGLAGLRASARFEAARALMNATVVAADGSRCCLGESFCARPDGLYRIVEFDRSGAVTRVIYSPAQAARV